MTKAQISNYLISNTVDKLAQYLVEEQHVDIPTALDTIYNSRTYEWLQNTDAELYTQSPGYVFEVLKDELYARA